MKRKIYHKTIYNHPYKHELSMTTIDDVVYRFEVQEDGYVIDEYESEDFNEVVRYYKEQEKKYMLRRFKE